MLPHNLRLQLEVYHQSLSNVPVSNNPNDIFWALNTFEGFTSKTLHSDGLGRNYGALMRSLKNFPVRLFFILSGSVYSSTFQTQKEARSSIPATMVVMP